ncbi:MAG TPA: permease-like cell division protein FtsX, partial [candidate division Zixibacteria bacterium]|nr:permease-like cell division protein FtsX [candidate division Zixibacteria bacterium]
MYRNPGTTVASVLSLALLFLLFDIFWIAAGTSDKFYSNLLSNLQLQIYVSESVPEKDIKALTLKITEINGVADVQYITREMARKELAGLVGTDLLVGYDESNPLPRSYTLLLMPTHLNSESIKNIESEIMKISGIDKIDYSRLWLEKAESTREIILNVGLILGALILFTTVVSSANNIRLMTRTRAVGFWQMRLQGAGRIFIASPFVLE